VKRESHGTGERYFYLRDGVRENRFVKTILFLQQKLTYHTHGEYKETGVASLTSD
jgi:hypothetical protein